MREGTGSEHQHSGKGGKEGREEEGEAHRSTVSPPMALNVSLQSERVNQ